MTEGPRLSRPQAARRVHAGLINTRGRAVIRHCSFAPIGILRTNENGGGNMTEDPRLSRPARPPASPSAW